MRILDNRDSFVCYAQQHDVSYRCICHYFTCFMDLIDCVYLTLHLLTVHVPRLFLELVAHTDCTNCTVHLQYTRASPHTSIETGTISSKHTDEPVAAAAVFVADLADQSCAIGRQKHSD